jgi:mono/diheme cytochrome c family protein
MMGLNLLVVLPILAGLVLLRMRKTGAFSWGLAWWCAIFLSLKYGFVIAIPASVQMIYMMIVTISALAYFSSSRQRWSEFTRPVMDLILEPRYKPLLGILLLLIPVAAAAQVYNSLNVPIEAPSFGRTIHPAPPDEITVHDTKIDMISGDSPYRELEHSDPEAFKVHLENGRRVYFQNCFYCHGDAMAGDGMFAYGLNPIPSNFTDQGVLPMLQENFLYWRVATGGPGLPEEGGPWDTAMPAWEKFLSSEEMWDVILFLYDYTDYTPRALHEIE